MDEMMLKNPKLQTLLVRRPARPEARGLPRRLAPAEAQTLPAVTATQLATLVPGQEAREEVILFEVSVPANAQLMIDDKKTESTGESRIFQTPPLKVGGRYNYTLKATAGGKVVTRQIHLTHGAANSIDLRPDFQATSGKPRRRNSAQAREQQEAQHCLHHGR
jgi:uncharacterized protein (TIGR03000 family)